MPFEMDPADPIALFNRWKQDALLNGDPEPDAMTVATVDRDGMPHARVVYLRNLVEEGFVFYTNYKSAKATQLLANPNVALNFHWTSIERQVRICGLAEKAPEELSDIYFEGRDRESQLGAWASPQSQLIPDRKWLLDKVADLDAQYAGKPIPRPPHWGGFLVRPATMEFWTGRTARLHDRSLYTRDGSTWKRSTLAP